MDLLKMAQTSIHCKLEDYLIILDELAGKGTAFITMLIGNTRHSFKKILR